jgi:hypothetical protein
MQTYGATDCRFILGPSSMMRKSVELVGHLVCKLPYLKIRNCNEIGICKRQGNQETELYIVDSNGHNLRQVTYGNSSNWPLSPVWSPDGQHVLFEFNHTLQLADTSSSCEIVTR